MRKQVLCMLIPLALLASCQDKPVSQMSYAEIKSLQTELRKRCAAEGIKPNSPEMNPCLQQEATREISMRNQRFQARQAFGDAMIEGGQSFNAPAQAPYRPMNCTSTPSSTWVGGQVSQVRTSCY